MKLMIDLNLLLDVFQKRQPHYNASAQVLDFALKNNCGCVAAHAITTLHYLVTRYAGRQQANELTDWLLKNFTIAPVDQSTFLRARTLYFADFEDAVVCACAEQQHCQYIVTRNNKDFINASIAVTTPTEFLASAIP
jgi:predicted nucleic acid-binding protein